MANGKEIDMEQLVEASDSLSASMDTFLQTELNYIRYLRNRQRYYLGLKHAAVTPTIINNFTKKKEEDRGRGFIPPWWRRRRVPKRRRQPQEQESRVRVPITVLETETATETQQERSRVKIPQEQTQTQGQTIPETQTQPDIIGNLVPENVNADIVAQQQTQYDALVDALTKQREEDTNEVRSGSLEKGGFVPEPALAWQLLDGTALVKRIEYELANGIGTAGLPATLYERGSVHHGMALNAILAVEGLNIPEALSINNAISVENMTRLDVTRPEVEGGWSWFDVAQVIGTIILPFLDGPVPVGDAAAFASLANLMMKGRVTWAMVRPLIRIFGPKVVQYVKTQLMNLGVKPEMFSMSGNSGSLSTATAAFASGGVITSPTRASAMGLNAFIGEANEAEAIIPMSKMGDAIEAVYREGASILVGSTQALLAKSNSPATTSVLIAANRLEQLVGSERVQIEAPWIPKNLLKGLDKFFFWKKDRKEETNTETENEDTLKTNNFSMDTSSKDFNALVAISSLEAGNEQARVDVAQSIYNRFNDPNQLYGTSIFDIITADGQYQPAFTDPTATSGEGTNTSDAWLNIKDKKTAINAMISYWSKKGVTYTYAEMEALFDSTALALQNQQLIESARDHVGGRTEFLGSASTLHPLDKGEEAWRGSEQDNRFFEAYGTGGETNEKIKSGWTTNPLLLNSIQPSSNINKEMVIEEPIRQAIKEGNIVEILPQIVQVPVEIPVPIIIDKVEEVMAQMPLFFDPLTKGVG